MATVKDLEIWMLLMGALTHVLGRVLIRLVLLFI